MPYTQLFAEASRLRSAAHASHRAAAMRPAATESEESRSGKSGRCACGGSCPRCRSHPGAAEESASRRAAGTDDLMETDLSVPRAEGDAGALAPMDAGAPGGAPEPSCCDKAFSKGLAASDYGGVICCKNVKHSCVWPSNMSSALTNAKAKSISIDAARV